MGLDYRDKYSIMASYRIHNIRFYNLEPKSVTCLCHESKTKKLALARLARIYVHVHLHSKFVIFTQMNFL